MDFEKQIEKMYGANLASQKEQLQQGYSQSDADLTAEKEKAQKATDANLTRTAVEAQKAAVNTSELHNAYGLSSGTRAQARLAQENQLQADLTALRAQQQTVDADVERQRTLLSQEYASAIREAQAENDLAKAQVLYERAQLEDDRLYQERQLQEQRAYEQQQLLAQQAFERELAAANRAWQAGQAKEQAKAQAEAAQQQAAIERQMTTAKYLAEELGDWTLMGQLYGWDNATIARLNGDNVYEYTSTPATQEFSRVIMDRKAWMDYKGYRSYMKKGSNDPSFDNLYKGYVEENIDKWLSAGKLTDQDVASLMLQYGLI